jgi:hypothetical protein
MLPTASDLDDPDGFVHREHLDFSELDKMLGEAAGRDGGGRDGQDRGTDEGGQDKGEGESGT